VNALDDGDGVVERRGAAERGSRSGRGYLGSGHLGRRYRNGRRSLTFDAGEVKTVEEGRRRGLIDARGVDTLKDVDGDSDRGDDRGQVVGPSSVRDGDEGEEEESVARHGPESGK
jgi:hypothetical protein